LNQFEEEIKMKGEILKKTEKKNKSWRKQKMKTCPAFIRKERG